MGLHLRCSHRHQKGLKTAAATAEAIGEGLQAFCIRLSRRSASSHRPRQPAPAPPRRNQCFAFLAGHESFAAAEGAIGIANSANRVRKEPLRVILNGLGKDAAYIILRINGFYVETEFDYYTNALTIVEQKPFSKGNKAAVKCYGADDVREGVAIMHHEAVDVSITGNSTNPTPFPAPRRRHL